MYVCENGGFRKRYLEWRILKTEVSVFVWTGENGGFRKRLCHWNWHVPVSLARKSINNRSNMAGYLAVMLFALISTLIACLELNAALINLYTLILRKRQNLLRSFVDGPLQTGQRSRPKPYPTRRRFWTRPGRTSAWWDNFVSGIFIPEE